MPENSSTGLRLTRLSKKSIDRILLDARAVTTGASMTNTSIAICSSGGVHFVPSVAEPGDLFCEIPSSNIVLLVGRRTGAVGWYLIGRAINFLSDPMEKYLKFSYSPMVVQQMKELGREVT